MNKIISYDLILVKLNKNMPIISRRKFTLGKLKIEYLCKNK